MGGAEGGARIVAKLYGSIVILVVLHSIPRELCVSGETESFYMPFEFVHFSLRYTNTNAGLSTPATNPNLIRRASSF